MDTVLRATFIYLFLFAAFRFSGKRTLAQITTFDFVLLLVVSEAVQQAMSGDDYSVVNAVVIVATLLTLDIAFSLWKQKAKGADKWLDGLPLILVRDGKPLHERLENSRVDESDILEVARRERGIERLEEIKYAVLERDGEISIVPMSKAASAA